MFLSGLKLDKAGVLLFKNYKMKNYKRGEKNG